MSYMSSLNMASAKTGARLTRLVFSKPISTEKSIPPISSTIRAILISLLIRSSPPLILLRMEIFIFKWSMPSFSRKSKEPAFSFLLRSTLKLTIFMVESYNSPNGIDVISTIGLVKLLSSNIWSMVKAPSSPSEKAIALMMIEPVTVKFFSIMVFDIVPPSSSFRINSTSVALISLILMIASSKSAVTPLKFKVSMK